MKIDLPPTIANDYINTDDLAYTSPDKKYSFQFSYWGKGLFFISSKGYVDDIAITRQLELGDIARQRLETLSHNANYHIVWDMSEVKGASLLSRRIVFSKLRLINNFGSISLISGNKLVISFAKILSILLPNIKFFFFRSKEEAIYKLNRTSNKIINENLPLSAQTDSYSRFINLWQLKSEFLNINNQHYKVTTRENWRYTLHDNSFKISSNVIEGNIVKMKCEGFINSSGIDAIYSILEDIMNELGFNDSDNRFYSIIDFKKVKGISLAARKRTLYYESLYRSRSFMVILVPSPILQFLFKIVLRISNNEISHWQTVLSVEEAITIVTEHRKGIMLKDSLLPKDKSENSQPDIPDTRSEMIRLIHRQHEELVNLKKYQHDQVQKIVEIAGRMTWDESFVPPEISPDYSSPFNEIYNSLSVLFQDFKEIINEKVKHTQQLVESENKYKNLINLAGDLICVYQDHELKFINPRVFQILGYNAGDILGRPLDNFFPPTELSKLKKAYEQWLPTETEDPWILETEIIHRNGHHIPISVSVGRITYETAPAAMMIARDISQKQKNEAELDRYRNHLEDIIKQRTFQLQKEISERKIAEESDRLKTAFLSNMSHEIRTPMNAIISFSNFLKDSDLTPQQHEEYLNYIQSSGQSLLNLINDIIDISKIESGQLLVLNSLCPINNLLEELYNLFEESRKKNKKDLVELRLIIPLNSQNTVINTDPYRLKQILSNLLDNALKFTDNGFIEFGYKFTDTTILFFVKDTGIGIPDDKKEIIFRRFGKIEQTTRNLSGTGLGLAISQQLATLLQGALWVESKMQEGTTFFLQLPFTKLANQISPEASRNAPVKKIYDWTRKKILIAEDEELNFKVLQIALKKTGAEILRATNGLEAIEEIGRTPDISVILMDIQMPVMDGYEAMLKIKQYRPEIPIIAQTAFAMLEEQKKCIDKGFDDYITKPIKIDELTSKIDVLINHSINYS